MDIKCPRCAEPWEIDCLHEAGAIVHKDFDFMRKLFYRYGCAAIEQADEERIAEEGTCEQTAKGRSIGVLMDLLDHDVDGLASMIEDFEYEGLL